MPRFKHDDQVVRWLHPLLSKLTSALDQKLQVNTSVTQNTILNGMTEEVVVSLLANNLNQYPAIYSQYKLERICDFCLGEKLLGDNLTRQRLIILIPPLQVSTNCPPSLQVDLALELVEELKVFLQTSYSFPDTRPIEIHTHFLRIPLHDQDLEALHQLFAPLPVLVIYTTITDCRVYTHMAWWVIPAPFAEYLSLSSWDWEEMFEGLVEEGIKKSHALRLVRQSILRVYEFLLVIFCEWYYSFYHQDSYLAVLQAIAPLRELSELEINLSLIKQVSRDHQNLVIKKSQLKTADQKSKLLELGKKWQLFTQFTPHQGIIFGIMFYPQHNWLLIAGSQGFLRIFSLATHKQVLSLNGHTGDIVSMVASHRQKLCATLSSGGQVKVWELGSLTETISWKLGLIGNCLSFSNDYHFLACGTHDGHILIWDVWAGKLFRQFSAHQQAIYCLQFTPDGGSLITGGQDGYLKIWNYINDKLEHYFLAHPEGVLKLEFSPLGDYLASVGRNGGIKLWKKRNFAQIGTLGEAQQSITAIAFNNNQEILATGDLDGRVQLWDLNSQQKIIDLSHASHPILCLTFDQKQRLAAGSSWQNNIRVWHYA